MPTVKFNTALIVGAGEGSGLHRRSDLSWKWILTTKLTTTGKMIPGAASVVRINVLAGTRGPPGERRGPSVCYHDHHRSPLPG